MTDQTSLQDKMPEPPQGAADKPDSPAPADPAPQSQPPGIQSAADLIAQSMPLWLEKITAELASSLAKKVSAEVARVFHPDDDALNAVFAAGGFVLDASAEAPGLSSRALLVAGQDAVLSLAAAKLGLDQPGALDDAATAAFTEVAQSVFASLQAAWAGRRPGIAVGTAQLQSAGEPPQGVSSSKAVVAEVSLTVDGRSTPLKLVLADSLVDSLVSREPAKPGPTHTHAVRSLARILNVLVPVVVEIARRPVTIKEVVNFKPGTVIEFSKKSDDLLDLTAGKARIGKGEAVKLGESFGLRIIEVGSIHDRIKGLGR